MTKPIAMCERRRLFGGCKLGRQLSGVGLRGGFLLSRDVNRSEKHQDRGESDVHLLPFPVADGSRNESEDDWGVVIMLRQKSSEDGSAGSRMRVAFYPDVAAVTGDDALGDP